MEAPRWYWSGGKMEESVREETQRAMSLIAPGPHAVLLMVPVNQFTEVGGASPISDEGHFQVYQYSNEGFDRIKLF